MNRTYLSRRSAIKAGGATLLLSTSGTAQAETKTSLIDPDSLDPSSDASTEGTDVTQNGKVEAPCEWMEGASSTSDFNYSLKVREGYPIAGTKSGICGDRHLDSLTTPYTVHTKFKTDSKSLSKIALFYADIQPDYYIGFGFVNDSELQIEKVAYDGVELARYYTSNDFLDGSWHDLRVIFGDSSILIYDGDQKLDEYSYSGWNTDSTPYWGSGASLNRDTKNAIIDQFAIYPDAAPPSDGVDWSNTKANFPLEFGGKHPRPKNLNSNISDDRPMLLDEANQDLNEITNQLKPFGEYFDECIDTILQYSPGANDHQFRDQIKYEINKIRQAYEDGYINKREAVQVVERNRIALTYGEALLGCVYTDAAKTPENTRSLVGVDPDSIMSDPAVGLFRIEITGLFPIFGVLTVAEKIAKEGLPQPAGWVASKANELNLVENIFKIFLSSKGLNQELADVLLELSNILEDRIRSTDEAQTAEEVYQEAQTVTVDNIDRIASAWAPLSDNWFRVINKIPEFNDNLIDSVDSGFNESLGDGRDRVARHVGTSHISTMEDLTSKAADEYAVIKNLKTIRKILTLLGQLTVTRKLKIALRIVKAATNTSFKTLNTKSAFGYGDEVTDEYINAMQTLENNTY